MKIERLNGTDYAEMYGIYEDNGTPVGSAEVKIAGWECGKIFVYPLTNRYTVKDLRRIFKEGRRNGQN